MLLVSIFANILCWTWFRLFQINTSATHLRPQSCHKKEEKIICPHPQWIAYMPYLLLYSPAEYLMWTVRTRHKCKCYTEVFRCFIFHIYSIDILPVRCLALIFKLWIIFNHSQNNLWAHMQFYCWTKNGICMRLVLCLCHSSEKHWFTLLIIGWFIMLISCYRIAVMQNSCSHSAAIEMHCNPSLPLWDEMLLNSWPEMLSYLKFLSFLV